MKNFLSVFRDYLLLTFGTVVYVLAWTSFMIPNGIASGGGTGLCTIIYFATNGAIPVSTSFFVLNAILLIVGFLVLGKAFGFKTIYVIILSTVLFDIFPKFDWTVTFDEKFLVAVVGGIMEAVGIGLVLLKGGSTGGTDIAAMIVLRGHDLRLCCHDYILVHGRLRPSRAEIIRTDTDILVQIQ